MAKRETIYDIVGQLFSKNEVDFELTNRESKALGKYLGEWLSSIHERKKSIVYTHNRIQSETASWLEYFGYVVSWEVPFSMGKFNTEQVRFDLVADKGKTTWIIEVKDIMNKRDFGQINYYADMLQKTKTKAKLFLALDFLGLDDAMDGETVMGDLVKEIMEREQVGLMFIDKEIILICHNYDQLMLKKMPDIYYEEDE